MTNPHASANNEVPLSTVSTNALPLSTTPSRRSWRRRAVIGILVALFTVTLLTPFACKWFASRELHAQRAESAIRWLHFAQRVAPRDGEIEFWLARSYRQLGHMDSVRDHLDRAFQLKHSVQALEREQWLALAQTGQLAVAEPHLSQLLMDTRGDGAEICAAFASGFHRVHRIDEAVRLLNVWIADEPTHPHPHFLRGRINVEAAKTSDAERDFRRALDLEPHHAEAALRLGMILIERSRPQEALPFFDIAERDPKQRSLARRYRMKSLKRLGRIDEARQLAAELLATASNNPDVLLEAGLLESEAGEFQVAIEHLQLADRLRPHSPAIAQALAIAFRSANRVDEALPLLEFARVANEQLARAVTLVARVDRNPRDAEARCEIGRIYLEYGLPEEGVTWLHGALNFDPNNRTAHALLADYYKARSTESATFAKFAIEHRRQAGP